jgi:hypothetical protein
MFTLYKQHTGYITDATPVLTIYTKSAKRLSIAVKWLALVLHIWELWVQNLMGYALLVEVFHGFTNGISVHNFSDSSVTNYPM